MLKVRLGIRSRVLAIALIPSLALLGVGVGTAGYLVQQGRTSEQWGTVNRGSMLGTRDVVAAVEKERMLSLWQLSGQVNDPAALAAARNEVDAAFATLLVYWDELQNRQDGYATDTGGFDTLRTRLPQIRGGIDAGALPLADTYSIYNQIIDAVAVGTNVATTQAPNARVGVEILHGLRVLHTMEAMSRAAALTGAELRGQLSVGPIRDDYRNLVGAYRTTLPQVLADLGDDPAAAGLKAAVSSPAWQQVALMENHLITPPEPDKYGDVPPAPLSFAEWRTAQAQLTEDLTDAWVGLNDRANEIAAEDGQRTVTNSLWAGAGLLALSLAAFLLSLWMANRLIGRLTRLRKETLNLAEVELPETMRKVGAGEQVDTDGAHLDFGDDEIGSVAEAFNRAHSAAVTAAVDQARTREGVRAVFLNIAHRSQMVVHRQLEILDEAERRQEDPAMLETFFRLDHLATRERRNAENLIILGGGEPGRQWRTPVPLVELVRSAIGETLDYARVHTRRMPQVFIVGNVVADLIHLLAELVDNATSFSPPQSRVEVSGTVVGKGIAVEITDQGMGMPTEDLDRVNEMLRNPPDFGVDTLSATSRLGLFIVSQLGERHGISVQLTESEYGGIRAIVLVPNSVIAPDAGPKAGSQPERYAAGRTDGRGADPVPPPMPSATGSAAAGVATLAPPALAPPTEQPAPAATPPQDWAAVERIDSAPPHPERPDHSGTTPWHDIPTPPAEQESRSPQSAPEHGGGAVRPSLPRRRRQASLAPELAHDPRVETDAQQPQRSAEQARDLMSAIAYGTAQARHSAPPPGFETRDDTEGEGR